MANTAFDEREEDLGDVLLLQAFEVFGRTQPIEARKLAGYFPINVSDHLNGILAHMNRRLCGNACVKGVVTVYRAGVYWEPDDRLVEHWDQY